MVGVFAGVVLVLLLASLARSSVLYDKLVRAKDDLDGWKKEASERWSAICDLEDEREGFTAIQAENTRLKKAASKLIIQVAESFGKEVTNPKQAK